MYARIACAAALAASHSLVAADITVGIRGLNQPTSVTWDSQGAVYISEKAGVVKRATSFAATSATPILDIQSKVANYGDLGFESIAWTSGFLYTAYVAGNTTYNDTCPDNGQPNGRSNGQITGCKVYGVLSRWPMNNGTITGPEEFLLDSTSSPSVCAQFGTGPIDRVAAGPDGAIYLTAGAGYDQFTVDQGQLGDNPCGVPGAQLGGAFRSQDLGSLDGKFMRLDPVTKAVTVLAKGLNNPWRFAIAADNNTVYVGDTGLVTWEEVNTFRLNDTMPNFGFPCFEGNGNLTEYMALGTSVCSSLLHDSSVHFPFFTYKAPNNASRVSISALAVHEGRVFYGDYSASVIVSMNSDGSQARTEMHGAVWPVDMQSVPGVGLVYVDIVTGSVKSVLFAPAPSVSGASTMTLSALGVTVMCALLAVLML